MSVKNFIETKLREQLSIIFGGDNYGDVLNFIDDPYMINVIRYWNMEILAYTLYLTQGMRYEKDLLNIFSNTSRNTSVAVQLKMKKIDPKTKSTILRYARAMFQGND